MKTDRNHGKRSLTGFEHELSFEAGGGKNKKKTWNGTARQKTDSRDQSLSLNQIKSVLIASENYYNDRL